MERANRSIRAIKVWNDVPDFGGLDGVSLIDHVNMNPMSLGPVKRWELFVPNFGLWSSTALPTNLEFDTLGLAVGSDHRSQCRAGPGGLVRSDPDRRRLARRHRGWGATTRCGPITLWPRSPGCALWKNGDFNIDGAVDGGDYTLWADHYLEEIPLSAAALAMAVPEPGSLSLALLRQCAGAGGLRGSSPTK